MQFRNLKSHSAFQLIQVHGANVDIPDQNNFKVIQKSIAMGNFEVFNIIFNHKISLAIQDSLELCASHQSSRKFTPSPSTTKSNVSSKTDDTQKSDTQKILKIKTEITKKLQCVQNFLAILGNFEKSIFWPKISRQKPQK